MSRRSLLVVACGLTLLIGVAGGQATPLPPGTSEPAEPRHRQIEQPDATAAEPLASAEAKIAAGDYPAARALLVPYLSAHPADARALFDLGYVDDAEGHVAAAEADYRKAIAGDPKQFEARLALGLLLLHRTPPDATEARRQLEAATQLEPAPPNPAAQAQALRTLARLLRTTDPEAARQALLAALKLSPQTLADTLLTAQIAEAAGDPDTAEQAYRGVLAAAPNGGSDTANEATQGLVRLLVSEKKYAEAEPLLRKALESNATNPVLNTELANLLATEGKQQEAIAVLENLHQALPDDPGVDRMLADLYTQTGQAAKADPLYILLLAAPRPDAALLAARGDNLIRQKRFAEAVLVLERATELDPKNGEAWSSLAFAASTNHQPRLTLDALAMRSKVMSETPASYFLAATACDTLHQTKRAVDLYKQFLAVAGGMFPDEEWEAKHRLTALTR